MIDASNLPDQPDPFRSGLWVGEEAGDAIVVRVTGRDDWDSKFHEEPDPVVIGTDASDNGGGEEIKIVGRRAHLRALIAEHDPQPGDIFAVRYFGQTPGTRSHGYAARCERGFAHSGKSVVD